VAEVDVTRMSSKGQIVIPREMRDDFEEGEKFVIIKSGKQLILKRTEDFDKNLEEDLRFAKRTAEALKRYERGEFIEMDFNDFLKRLKKW
jgi:AbrB family looped-hinge helix DNA binding protein